MKLQSQLTHRLASLGLLVALLLVTASIAFAQTVTVGVTISDVDDDTIVLVNQDDTPTTLTNTSIIVSSGEQTYTIVLSDTIIPSGGAFNIDYSDLGIDLEEGDTIQMVYTDPDTGEEATLSELTIAPATAVSLGNMSVVDNNNMLIVILLSLGCVLSVVALRLNKQQ